LSSNNLIKSATGDSFPSLIVNNNKTNKRLVSLASLIYCNNYISANANNANADAEKRPTSNNLLTYKQSLTDQKHFKHLSSSKKLINQALPFTNKKNPLGPAGVRSNSMKNKTSFSHNTHNTHNTHNNFVSSLDLGKEDLLNKQKILQKNLYLVHTHINIKGFLIFLNKIQKDIEQLIEIKKNLIVKRRLKLLKKVLIEKAEELKIIDLKKKNGNF